MWIFEGILYVILLLVFIRYDRKKRLWKKTVSQEEEFEHYLSELSVAYGKQKNIDEAVAEVEDRTSSRTFLCTYLWCNVRDHPGGWRYTGRWIFRISEKSEVSERGNPRKSPALQVENAWVYRA